MKKSAVLLVNLGTPAKLTKKSVRKFLANFLADRRVVDLPRWLWLPLLNFVILPIRVPIITKLYQKIWLKNNSPLRFYTQKLAEKLSLKLAEENILVDYAMTYGNPSIAQQLQKFQHKGITNLTVLPLYPQYSVSTTAPVFDQIAIHFKQQFNFPAINFLHDYHDHPLYIQALVKSIKQKWTVTGKSNLLVFSFHGIPKRYIRLGCPYQTQSFKTAELVVKSLGLKKDDYAICYQSRIGKQEWLTPYLDKSLITFAKTGVGSIDVVSPAFACDCLETLEELAIRNKKLFLDNGGETYHYIPCLNNSEDHINLLCALALDNSLLPHKQK
ncbi:MAG: ferrochelatase [Psychromonas sp.]|nr:ferrochelatase [Psychromonas sp.]